MSRLLWVVDTNVLVSAALTPGGVCDLIFQHVVRGTVGLAWDNVLLAEYRDLLSRPKFGLSRVAVRRLLEAFPESTFHQGVRVEVELPDPDDLPFLAVAMATPERCLITGNATHFPAGEMKALGVTVLNPRQALEGLDAAAKG